MGRMVDEERTNSGTLKALGYGNADVMLKFTVYGFAASTLGTCIGVLAGHTLLPLIVAHAYSAGFTMPDIMLKFHPWITMAAFALAWISAVVPAWPRPRNCAKNRRAYCCPSRRPKARKFFWNISHHYGTV